MTNDRPAKSATHASLCDDVAEKIDKEFGVQLIRLIRRELFESVRPMIGASDICQDANKSFWSEIKRGQFIPDTEELVDRLKRFCSIKTKAANRRYSNKVKKRRELKDLREYQGVDGLDGPAPGQISRLREDREIEHLLENPDELRKRVHERFECWTEEEKQILDFMLVGMTNKEIGEAMEVSEETARTRKQNILRRLPE